MQDFLKETFPWAFEKNKEMIIGDDIDSIISACFLHHFLKWEIKGFYVGYQILFIESGFNHWRNSIFVDLDISQNDIRSIGHHILQITSKDEIKDIGHINSLNPNLIRKITMENFKIKYPLATIHLLMWLHDISITIDSEIKKIIWIPDSTWINGQSHRFKKNVQDWLNHLNLYELLSQLDEVDTNEFEKNLIDNVYTKISKTGFEIGSGQVTSRHFKLSGFQCQFYDPRDSINKINELIKLICNIFKWNPLKIPDKYDTIEYKRSSQNIPKECFEKGLAYFFSDKKVFSYVIPNYNRINYTTIK